MSAARRTLMARHRKTSRAARAGVESLEGRRLLATITANATADDTAGIFSNAPAPALGHEQGRTFVGLRAILNDGTGKGTSSVVGPSAVDANTATVAVGNTSAFPAAAGTQALPATSTMLSSSLNPALPGQALTFTAVVSASGASGTPTGTVTFTIGGVAQGPLPLAVVGGQDVATISRFPDIGTTTVLATYNGDASFAGSASNPLTQAVNAVGASPQTTTTLTSDANPSAFGQPVTFTAVVAPTGGAGTPTGEVIFSIKDGEYGRVPLAVVGGRDVATFTTSDLHSGTFNIRTLYGGDANFGGNLSNFLVQVVLPPAVPIATTITLAASPNPSTFGQPVTFLVAVSPPSGTIGGPVPSGTATLRMRTLGEEDLIVATGPLDATGHAVFTVTTLQEGTDILYVGYSGDSNFTSNTYGDLIATVFPFGDGPRVASARRLGYHEMPTTLVIGFNSPLDPASAQDVANYRIVGPLSRTEVAQRVTSAVYDPTAGTVTLHLSGRLNVHRKYQLTINGSQPGAIIDTSGRPLDGKGEGHPGSDSVTTIDAANLVVTGRMSRGATEALRLAARQRRLDAARHAR